MEIYTEKVAPILDKVCKTVHLDALDENENLQALVKKIPIPVKPSHIILSLSAVLVLLSLLNVGSSLICNIVGFIYPAYMSFKALETTDNKDDKQWLTYWVVYSLFTVMDSFIGFTLSFIPFYYFLKLAFFVYLFHPKTLGAVVVYDKVVQPLLKKYESDIDQNINKLASK
ncbi:HVA22/TB2/DP1 family protein (macronuclear) [Tetrahymena thermophila SB210]|uniref:HVA22/TB2/DP1 family protein n=1 Tax=Tetrahymena thermophila (strain SB210) TaxID=312017 RepID=Q22SB4_TETTS|nr:HVA22/TB2/DP1 family protein [Tetrahymena thermophila SB210]EAR87858.1 HVA22/TB2/DP1 family protein [Tetrahymena thermophila SB210]|eukprot:XP_001008103.1 HVA22/TB2/DP1 family protein [Tetrahymena thermophila SB210]